MSGDLRVRRLIEEVLDSGLSPDEVCRDEPELLPQVRQRLRRVRHFEAQVDALLPPASPAGGGSWPAPSARSGFGPPELPDYEVQDELGRGGMGIVYRAWDRRLNRPVALKMLLAGAYARPQDHERFRREAEAEAGLRHPNIVQVYDVGTLDGRPYFIMEFVEGGSLAQKLAGAPLTAGQAAGLVAALAGAVQAAHDHAIIHRDLKPANVLLTADGTPKVTDFGLARRLEDGPALTRSGATLGTPSYMAPEQAQGETAAIGPATDIYALGAILYELLTGRPPFRAESATATLQQVVADEPVPPARLNPRVPRDLQTICLKCLDKEPHNRYVSAQALAEDIRRYERGEPIKARPVGPAGRTVRWVRRRPALAGALAFGAVLASALIVTILWWYGQRTALTAAAVAYAEADLTESDRLRDRGEFRASAAVLQRAKERLGEFVPTELRDRLSTAFRDLQVVTRLDAIRLERALVRLPALHKPPTELLGVLTSSGAHDSKVGHRPGAETSGRHYHEAFREAGIGAPGDNPAEAAARIRASPVRGALLAAMDDWAACATDREQQEWVVGVARRADPDPWRDRVRDPSTWGDPAALQALADRTPVASQSPQLLAVLGARLRAKKHDAVGFLERVASTYPGDFWVNVEMGNALCDRSNWGEAIGYYRTALALRPETVSLRYALGDLYLAHQRLDGAIAEYEQAGRLDPENPWRHNRLGFALAWKGGRDVEAIAQFREAIRLDPAIGWSHYYLAIALENAGRHDEAVVEFREVGRLLPEKRAEARHHLRSILLKQGRGTDARAAWKADLAADPPEHDAWFGYAELCLFLGDDAEYRRARTDLLARFSPATDSAVAERTGRACLLLPAAEDELRQAVALTERAVDAVRPGRGFAYPYCLFAEGLARYRQDRLDDAIEHMNGEAASVMGPSPRLVLAMAQYRKGRKDLARATLAAALASHDWSVAKADDVDAWIAHILRREAEALIPPGSPASPEGQCPPRNGQRP